MKKIIANLAILAIAMAISLSAVAQTKLTIGTVNNGDMVRMQSLADEFKSKNPGVELVWVTLEENMLRQRVTMDIATKGGQFDVMTIGTYEVPIWGKKGWLVPLNFDAAYDVDDILPPIRSGLTLDGKLYAAPFYGESSMIMYRKDLVSGVNMDMPQQPTWGQVYEIARAIHEKDNGAYGICLRGKAGWGENGALITTLSNAFGARWFDEKWRPQFDQPEWNHALSFYVDMMNKYGPPGASSNGFNENLALFNSGKCGMWIDATVAASFVTNPKDSKVHDKVDFAQAPCAVTCRGGNWLWAWSLAIPAGSKQSDAAMKFISWATSKAYLELVASKEGWANVPPGTRASLYKNSEYLNAAPFAQMTLNSIKSADPVNGTLKPKPYVGVQFAAIPEFQGLGTSVGQQFSAALTGKVSVKKALENAQRIADRIMRKGGYY
ncbi:MAG: sugar ABC transporter substrate-binding protein [SAR324 cluster bacterium]|nr:sugar ABC transporter substrate-binding protein [SAR324 cluster bacterium]